MPRHGRSLAGLSSALPPRPGGNALDNPASERPWRGIPSPVSRSRGSRFGTASRGAESLDVAGLPGRLDRPRVEVLADEGDRLTGAYAIPHGQTAAVRDPP